MLRSGSKKRITPETHSPRGGKNADPTKWMFWIYNRRGQSILLTAVGLILGLLCQYWNFPFWISYTFYCISTTIAGYPIVKVGLSELRQGRINTNLLISIAIIGAIFLGDFIEAAFVLFLFSLGNILTIFTFRQTHNAIDGLVDVVPKLATVKREGKEVNVPLETINLGEILIIKPRQYIPLDGIVVAGASAINQSIITGTSISFEKTFGDRVYAGTFNQGGYLEIKVTAIYSNITLNKIINIFDKSQETSTQSEQKLKDFIHLYTPIIILLTFILAFVIPLVLAQPLDKWLYRALVILVIVSPYALLISTSIPRFSAMAAATRKGVLFKGCKELETAANISTIAFEKTGTITQPLPAIEDIYGICGASYSLVLQLAASIEQQCEHPLAKAIIEEAENRELRLLIPHKTVILPGKGVEALIGESAYFVGNRRLFLENQISLPAEAESLIDKIESQGRSPTLVGNKKELLGIIATSDGIKLEATEAVRLLKRSGLQKIVMLTSDTQAMAYRIAKQINVTDYKAELLPRDKLKAIQELKSNGKSHGIVGMIGDAINDAATLAEADISFGMSDIDIALETTDVILLDNDLRKIAYAIDLSHQTESVIRQNILFSFLIKVLFLLLATFGFIGLAGAVLVDIGSSLLVTGNGMRLYNR
jgi:Cd2+/Zn2+-exporting ATPase